MRAKWLGALAAIILLCRAVPAGAETATPGTTEPPAATAPATDGHPADEAKPKKKVRRHWRHRHWRHGYYDRPFFLLPPPRYWFRPWPHYRYYRRHRWHHRHHRFFFWRW